MVTSNYFNTFIAVAPDCPVSAPQEPPTTSARPTVAALQFDLVMDHPYEMTSDEILFAVHVQRREIADADLEAERERFLAKGQACLRASPLGKRYGWGTHHDQHGRVALYGVGTPDYKRLVDSAELAHTAAMRSARARP